MIICDRCKLVIEGAEEGHGFTCGYYATSVSSAWHKYARDGENRICDDCMWNDPRYIADYGDHHNRNLYSVPWL